MRFRQEIQEMLWQGFAPYAALTHRWHSANALDLRRMHRVDLRPALVLLLMANPQRKVEQRAKRSSSAVLPSALFDVDRSVLSGIEHEFDSRRRSRSLGSGLGIKDESRAPEERSYLHFWPNFRRGQIMLCSAQRLKR